ncbi:GH92 family glycosyl hydrolase [Aureibacter tunicatorum]|uniref:Alpha-1,2-mannosidase n=1 Tax=Aureibacter tunicatorum TaxID=866807 RepID=A0AAE3XP03_9BACT|nr:GH92 family glycosyl hydrolase [Aureibacter tunicatorum]MDR6238609.1 putative alpha-1,2-mannosidase [Aureibacter tunicatorum]BDD05460.1 alpha-1 2-mannosidase [Aureibacter tunicatorum]
MNKSLKKIFLSLGLAGALMSCATKQESKQIIEKEDPTSFVDPFVGTGSWGHTYPGATVPHGMVQLSPDNGTSGWDRISGYHYDDSTIASFSHTHFSGTGVGDLYDVAFMPYTKPAQTGKKELGVYSIFSHDKESAKPGYYKVHLDDYNIDVELTATERVGLQRYTFPESNQAQIKLDLKRAMNWDATMDTDIQIIDNQTIAGKRFSKGWAPDQRVYFYTVFSKPFDAYEVEEFDINGKKRNGIAHFSYKTKKGEQILVKTAISSVSIENAKQNMEAELSGFDFEQVALDAHKLWEKALSKITIKTDDEEAKIAFYTGMYQTMMAPTTFSDVNGEYKGVDGNTQKAEGFKRYDTFSLWDTFRALHPLFTITQPDNVNDMINSMLAHYKESGLLPVWSFAGNETNCMLGYHTAPVILDAYMKGIRNFDAELALEALVKSAMQDQLGLKSYKELGYTAQDEQETSVSYTLEYAYDDWCIAQLAKELGKQDIYEQFTKRANNYKNTFDPSSNFMRARDLDGNWSEGFDPIDYKNHHYMEGNAWQYTWFVPQDVKGMIELMGGNEKFSNQLDELFNTEHPVPEGGFPEWISGLKGIYVHGNEPSHHVAYLYNYAQKPWKTQEIIRYILSNLHKPTPEGIVGNEDCGQMSAWYVFSSLGFYPVNPADQSYVIGTPIFEEATINLDNGKSFVIKANNVSKENFYIQSVTLNGQPLNKSFITHQQLANGGEIVFEMGSKPNKNWGADANAVPPSMTK